MPLILLYILRVVVWILGTEKTIPTHEWFRQQSTKIESHSKAMSLPANYYYLQEK